MYGVFRSFASSMGPLIKELFLLPNQLMLFFLDRLGWLFNVAGDPGRSVVKLSCEERGRRPRNLRTELGRLLPVGLVGGFMLAFSFVVVCCRLESAWGGESRC